MKKVVITGFEAFGGYQENPTKELLNDDRIRVPGVEVIGLVLPCTYFGAFEILSPFVDKEKPDAIISTGLSSSVRGIRIETTFHNIMNGKYSDANGYSPQGLPIYDKPDAKDFLVSNADNIYLANILKKNQVPVELSIDADAFICNSLGYLTTKKILQNFLLIQYMFIHIPWTDNYKDKIQLEPHKIFLETEKYYKTIELLVKNI